MKQRSFILFILAVFCIGLMSSCDNDNNGDVRVLTKEEKARALSLTLGEYTTGMTFVLNQLSKPGSKYNKVDCSYLFSYNKNTASNLQSDIRRQATHSCSKL